MVLVKVSSTITKDKVIPRVLFNGVLSTETTYIRHIFGLDGSITIRDEWFKKFGYELKINPLDFGFTGTVELYEDATAQIVMVSYKFRWKGKDYEVQVHFYFGVDYGNRVKVKIKGILPRAGYIKIPFVAVTKKYEVLKKRFWTGHIENGEVLSGIGLDWSDVASAWSYDETAKTLTFTVGSTFTLDPSTVATLTSSTATQMPHQRKSFYAVGRHWASFSDGLYVKIYSSTDGVNWIDSTGDIDYLLRIASLGRKLSLFYSESLSKFDLATSQELLNDFIRYARATPNGNGTITYLSAKNAVTRFMDEAGSDGVSIGSPIWDLYKALVSGNIYSLNPGVGAGVDYTTEINTGDVGVGCKTPFTPYTTVNADDFGYATVGGTTSGVSGYKYGCRFQAPRTESISKIRIYFKGTSGIINAKAGMYSDSSGAPNALLGATSAVAVTTTASWVEFTFSSPISVTAGTYYWLALIADGSLTYYYDAGVTSQIASNVDDYADSFSDPFGSPAYADRKMSIFAYSTSLPTAIQMKGWQYTSTGVITVRKLWILDGKFTVQLRALNPTTLVHAGNLYARLWVSDNADMSAATALSSWFYVAVSFNGTLNQAVDAALSYNLNAAVGDALVVTSKYFYLELLWDVTTAATDARVQIEASYGYSWVQPPDHIIYFPNVVIDSDGYPWIGFLRYNGIGYYPYIAKGNANDGTWTFRLGSYRKLSATSQLIGWRVTPVSLTSGKMRVIYHRTAEVLSDLWDGSAWTTQNPPAITLAQAHGLSAINEGDDTIFGVVEGTTYHIKVIKHIYGVGWDVGYTTVQSSTTSTSCPVLSWQETGKFKVFWAGSPTANHIYHKTVVNMVPEGIGDWIDESTDVLTGNDRLTCFYKVYGDTYGDYIGLMYMTLVAPGPYNVKYAFKRLRARLPQNMSVLKSVFRFVLTKAPIIRRFTENLSAIRDVFSFVYTPSVVPVLIRKFTENLHVISDRFSRVIAYKRTFRQEAIVRDAFKRALSFIRKFVEDLSTLKDALTRRLSYRRRLAQTTVIQDIFKRLVSFPRFFKQDLFSLKAVFSRRINYVRTFPQTTIISDVFRRVATFPRRLVQDLSALKDVFSREATYTRRLQETLIINDVLKRFVAFPRRLVQDLSVLSVRLVRKVTYLRRWIENLSAITDFFQRKTQHSRKLVQTVLIEAVFARRLAYIRKQSEVIIVEVKSILKKIKKWLAWLTKRMRLSLEKTKQPPQAEFKT
jgi:hypothetical protein